MSSSYFILQPSAFDSELHFQPQTKIRLVAQFPEAPRVARVEAFAEFLAPRVAHRRGEPERFVLLQRRPAYTDFAAALLEEQPVDIVQFLQEERRVAVFEVAEEREVGHDFVPDRRVERLDQE